MQKCGEEKRRISSKYIMEIVNAKRDQPIAVDVRRMWTPDTERRELKVDKPAM